MKVTMHKLTRSWRRRRTGMMDTQMASGLRRAKTWGLMRKFTREIMRMEVRESVVTLDCKVRKARPFHFHGVLDLTWQR